MLTFLALLVAAQAADPAPRARDTPIGWERRVGVGVSVGLPTGVTGKLYLDRRARYALEGALAVRRPAAAEREVLTHLTAHTHPLTLVSSATLELPLRLGAGAFLGMDGERSPITGAARLHPRADGAFAGIRGVAGLDLDLVDAPLQFYLDFSPSLAVLPSTHLSIGGTLGARYYF